MTLHNKCGNITNRNELVTYKRCYRNTERFASVNSYLVKKATQLWSVWLLFWCLNLWNNSIALTIVPKKLTVIPTTFRITSSISKIFPLWYFPSHSSFIAWKFSYVNTARDEPPRYLVAPAILYTYCHIMSNNKSRRYHPVTSFLMYYSSILYSIKDKSIPQGNI